MELIGHSYYYLPLSAICFIASPSFANPGSAFINDNCDSSNTATRCLTGNQPSYFTVSPKKNTDFGTDPAHLEFKVSVKYPLWGEIQKTENDKFLATKGIYFGYTGKYDFYALKRYSSPIVSRQQNPGLFYKYSKKLVNSENSNEHINGFNGLSIGWYHESNGQDIDSQILFNQKIAAVETKLIEEKKPTDNKKLIASDYISRGWDYLGITSKYIYNLDHEKSQNKGQRIIDVYASIRLYCGCQALGTIDIEETSSWTQAEGFDAPGQRIKDYNTFSVIISHNFEKKDTTTPTNERWKTTERFLSNSRHSLNITAGKTLKNISAQYQMTHKVLGQIPLTFFYFNGYAENITTYQKRTKYVAFGIELW